MKRDLQSSAALAMSLLAGACQSQPATNALPAPPPVVVAEQAAPAPTTSSTPPPAAPVALDEKQVLSSLPGGVLELRRWRDARGVNVLVVSLEGPFPETNADEKGAKLHAALYTKKNDAFELVWKLFDEERGCPFDLSLGPLPKGTTVTDLDKDGTSEVTLVYKKTCRSDVSPANMKVILREGDAKYALRGLMCSAEDKRPTDAIEPCCGEAECKYESDKDFKGAPPAFLKHARKKWLELVKKDAFDQL